MTCFCLQLIQNLEEETEGAHGRFPGALLRSQMQSDCLSLFNKTDDFSSC